jgi:hypothetical protein
VTVRDNETFAGPDQHLWTQSQYAIFDLLLVALVAHVDIRIPALGLHGYGFAPGIGLHAMIGSGQIQFNNSNAFFSGRNDFLFVGATLGVGYSIVTFSFEGTTFAKMWFPGGGLGLGSISGTITW